MCFLTCFLLQRRLRLPLRIPLRIPLATPKSALPQVVVIPWSPRQREKWAVLLDRGTRRGSQPAMPTSHFELLLHLLLEIGSICRRAFLTFIETVFSRHHTSITYEDGSLVEKWMDVKETIMEFKETIMAMGAHFRPVLNPTQIFWKAQKRYLAEADGHKDADELWFAEMKRFEEIWPQYHGACSSLHQKEILDDSQNTGSADDFQEVVAAEKSTMTSARTAVLHKVAERMAKEDVNQTRMEEMLQHQRRQSERLDEMHQ